jgi:DNA replication protein DnaC
LNNTTTMERMRTMRLHGMLRAFKDSLETPGSEALTIDEMVCRMVDTEWDERYNKKLARLFKDASFRYRAHPEEIDYSPKRMLDRNKLSRLFSCEWIRKTENVIVTGKTGTGKSYMSCALGHAACVNGFRVRYANVMKLFANLKIARADGSYAKEMRALFRCDLVILDDFGLKPLDADSRLSLLELLEDRFHLHSTILVSQIPVDKWFDCIGDKTIADAICDRLVHNAHQLPLQCKDSMRKIT